MRRCLVVIQCGRGVSITLPPVKQRNEFRPIPAHPLRPILRGPVAQRLVLRDRLALFQPGLPKATAINPVRKAQQETGRTSLLTPDGRVPPGGGTASGGQTKVASGRQRAQYRKHVRLVPDGLKVSRLPTTD